MISFNIICLIFSSSSPPSTSPRPSSSFLLHHLLFVLIADISCHTENSFLKLEYQCKALLIDAALYGVGLVCVHRFVNCRIGDYQCVGFFSFASTKSLPIICPLVVQNHAGLPTPRPACLPWCTYHFSVLSDHVQIVPFCLRLSELVPTTNVCYNSLLWMCMLNPLLYCISLSKCTSHLSDCVQTCLIFV